MTPAEERRLEALKQALAFKGTTRSEDIPKLASEFEKYIKDGYTEPGEEKKRTGDVAIFDENGEHVGNVYAYNTSQLEIVMRGFQAEFELLQAINCRELDRIVWKVKPKEQETLGD